jgi:hypothetical protein
VVLQSLRDILLGLHISVSFLPFTKAKKTLKSWSSIYQSGDAGECDLKPEDIRSAGRLKWLLFRSKEGKIGHTNLLDHEAHPRSFLVVTAS